MKTLILIWYIWFIIINSTVYKNRIQMDVSNTVFNFARGKTKEFKGQYEEVGNM
jgi:hypothetical protein